MSEFRLRLVVVGLKVVSLLAFRNWAIVFWSFATALRALENAYLEDSISGVAGGLRLMLPLMAVPVMIPINVLLAFSSSRGLRVLYRAVLLVLTPFVVDLALRSTVWHQTGLLAIPVVVVAAAVIEIGWMVGLLPEDLEDSYE
jgi:hypothetical protein